MHLVKKQKKKAKYVLFEYKGKSSPMSQIDDGPKRRPAFL